METIGSQMNSLHGSSFAWAIRLLPPSQRQAMAALYGFCHLVDDIADGNSTNKLETLELYRQDLHALIQKKSVRESHIAALAPLLKTYCVPPEALFAILDGVSMDVTAPFHAPSWAVLEEYCRCVAGAVGIATLHIFKRVDMLPLAYPLGEALQLTNILRDRDVDAMMGRLYLPSPALTAAKIDPNQSIAAILSAPELPQALDEIARRAEEKFHIAENLLTQRSTARLWPVFIMMQTYHLALERMRCSGFRPIPLSPSRRLWIALCVRMKAFFTS